jgi:hypothetical protein
MGVNDPNVVRFAIDPYENDSPPIVDADGIEVFEIALELFQPGSQAGSSNLPVWLRH